jgi:aromatic ring-opening dioxygenase catalytic subunit (LigB family)
MAPDSLPTLFISHGAPTLPLERGVPAREFLAGIPIIQLSVQGHLDPSRHLALGNAIASLRHEGVLMIGSGGAVHPLGDPSVALGEGLPTEGQLPSTTG